MQKRMLPHEWLILLNPMLKRALLVGAVVAPSAAFAGHMYIFKDTSGNVLLTNVVNGNKHPNGSGFSAFNTRVKVTYYPDTNVHSYTNYGKTEAAVLPSYSRNRNTYDSLITASAANNSVDKGLLKAIMHTESSFNPSANSPVGAQGLMQLMPATARRFNVGNSWDPAQNIEGGAKYLSFLLKRYNNNLEHAIAAYNAGEGNVDKYNGIPPFHETQDYVKRVMSRFHHLYSGGSLTPSASQSTASNTSYSAGSTFIAPHSPARPLTLAAANLSNTNDNNNAGNTNGDRQYTDSAINALRH